MQRRNQPFLTMQNRQTHYDNLQLSALLILRLAIGWHFLYEGVAKLLNPNWSSVGYILDSKGVFSGLYHSMATNSELLFIIDTINIWGLILVGLGLILGGLTRIATYGGMVLLAFYYFSHPPLVGIKYALPTEGNYLIVDKVMIEFFAMWVLALFPTGKLIGLDRLICKKKI